MTTNLNQGIKTVLYSAADINRAKALFTKLLGVEPTVDSPYYVGFKVGDQEIGISLLARRRALRSSCLVSPIKCSLQSVV